MSLRFAEKFRTLSFLEPRAILATSRIGVRNRYKYVD